MRQIRVTIYDDYGPIPDVTALEAASIAVRHMPKRKGTITFKNGVCAAFSTRSKTLALQVWQRKTPPEQG